MRGRRGQRGWVAVLVVVLSGVVAGPASAADTVTIPDSADIVGNAGSLVLDAVGNPVISYFDFTNSDLKVLHCNDPACAGDDDPRTSPDTAGSVGSSSSIVLDGAGNPVVAYHDTTNDDLKVLHCNDPACALGGDSVTSVDLTSGLGIQPSLVLDSAGNPVVTSVGQQFILTLLRCNDPNCAGGDDSLTRVDTGVSTITTSLALDAADNPVVSYYDLTNGDLKLLHCNDPACAGVDDPIAVPDAAGDVGGSGSLALDAAGNPVVSYYDATNGDLKLLHCDDPACAPGGDRTTSPDTAGDVGSSTSLALDAAGNPVVSYYDLGNEDLRLLRCDDPDCAPGGDRITSPDTVGDVGRATSLELDAAGNPVVRYFDGDNGDLRVLHCDDPACLANLVPVADAGGPYSAARGESATLAGSGSDPDGGVVELAWDLDDDGVFDDATGPAPQVDTSGLEPGTYLVSLQVTDDEAMTAAGSALLTVTAAGTPPPGGGLDGNPATSERISSGDPAQAAVLASQARFPEAGSAGLVVLSRDDAFPDSLAGSALTGAGPLLVTDRATLTPATQDEIQRVLPPGATIYLLGGAPAIDPGIEIALQGLGYTTVRLAGPSRIETAIAVADEVRRLNPAVTQVMLARAFGAEGNVTSGWADSVSGGGWAARSGIPVLVTPTDAVHPAVAAWLSADQPTQTTLLGGPPALSAAVEAAVPAPLRVAGPERTATAAAIAAQLWQAPADGPRRFVVINAEHPAGWVFGLAAAGIAADDAAPILALTAGAVTDATRALVSQCGDPEVDLLLMGDRSIISQALEQELDTLDGAACP